MSQVTLWAGIMLYIEYFGTGQINSERNKESGPESSAEISHELLYFFGLLLSGTWVLSFITTIMMCKSEYRHTFTTTSTSKQFEKEKWDWLIENHAKDAHIAEIFLRNHDLYRHFDDEVKMFVAAYWDSWRLDQPKWFSEELIPLSILSEEMRAEVLYQEHYATLANLQQRRKPAPGGTRQRRNNLKPAVNQKF
jgi:hypothetical protein